jgi:methylphosphotriester-DNA--protein-cysteine methyltransferase
MSDRYQTDNSRNEKSQGMSLESDIEFFNFLESVIRMNYREKNFNVDELARISRISLSHLREQVRLHYGFPPHFLIENIRLENSFYLLMLDFDICDISIDVGFTNSQSYRRTFKRRLNISPTEFKELLNKDEENKLNKLKFFKNYLWNNKKSTYLTGEIAP